MGETQERRRLERQWCKCEVNWSYFNTETDRNGYLLNFSQAGGYLETAGPIVPGATVLVRVLQCLNCAHEHPEGLRFNAMAEVKWCRELGGNEMHHYGAGLRYHFPT